MALLSEWLAWALPATQTRTITIRCDAAAEFSFTASADYVQITVQVDGIDG